MARTKLSAPLLAIGLLGCTFSAWGSPPESAKVNVNNPLPADEVEASALIKKKIEARDALHREYEEELKKIRSGLNRYDGTINYLTKKSETGKLSKEEETILVSFKAFKVQPLRDHVAGRAGNLKELLPDARALRIDLEELLGAAKFHIPAPTQQKPTPLIKKPASANQTPPYKTVDESYGKSEVPVPAPEDFKHGNAPAPKAEAAKKPIDPSEIY